MLNISHDGTLGGCGTGMRLSTLFEHLRKGRDWSLRNRFLNLHGLILFPLAISSGCTTHDRAASRSPQFVVSRALEVLHRPCTLYAFDCARGLSDRSAALYTTATPPVLTLLRFQAHCGRPYSGGLSSVLTPAPRVPRPIPAAARGATAAAATCPIPCLLPWQSQGASLWISVAR